MYYGELQQSGTILKIFVKYVSLDAQSKIDQE